MVQIYKWHFIGLAIFSFLSFVAVVPAQPGTLGEPNESYVDDILKRWMANYLAISEFECRFSTYATVRDARDMAELRKSHAQKDQRGYYILSRFDFKYRPHDRFYRADGFIQSPGEGGKWQTRMYSSDGSDHRTFSEENYSGIIEPEERMDFHLFQNPNHYLNFDSDLASVYRAGGIVRESELIYTAKVPARFFPIPGRPPSQYMDTLRFHLSPNHGYMPQKIEVIAENGNLKYLHEVLDFAQLDGIWFPVRGTRSVNLKKNAEQMDYVDLLEIEPGSLKINPGLDRQVYRFEYPAGSAFINNATGEKVIGDEYRRRERLESEAYQAKMRAQTSGPWVWVTLGVAVALLLGWSVYRKFGAGALLLLSVCCAGCSSSGMDDLVVPAEGSRSSSLITIAPSKVRTKISADEAGDYTQEFSVRNSSTDNISLTGITSNCACLEATLDHNKLLPGECSILKVTARLRPGLKSEALVAGLEATDGVVNSTHSVIWVIERSNNWRPAQLTFSSDLHVNTEQKFGPFYFEVSDKVADLPLITVDDESGIFKLAGQVGTTTDQEGRRRISFDLIAAPKEVLRAPRYMIKVSLDGGEPAYYMLVCNLNVNPLVYFPTPVVRLSETETVVIVKCSKEPSNVRWEMTSQALDVEWRWNTDLAVGELLVRRPEILSNESFVDLTIVATIEGQEEAATCSLVPVPSD